MSIYEHFFNFHLQLWSVPTLVTYKVFRTRRVRKTIKKS